MTVWIKQGVLGDLQPVAQKGFGRFANLADSKNEDTFVTSLREGNHCNGSFHSIGLAFDIKKYKFVTITECRSAIGPGWDIVNEVDHWHFEYDPK
uniref:Peptidase n=1 Tax=viral metagenome TaxID=1070528 RepID=A0A6H2A2J4_9ZZZZ